MMKIATFSFNPFGVNTYLLIGENGGCVVVDCACSNSVEREQLRQYIEKNSLKPVLALNTHSHIDHICGVRWLKDEYSVEWGLHPDDSTVLAVAEVSAVAYGFEWGGAPVPDIELTDEWEFDLGGEKVRVIHTPGHSAGGVCFYVESAGVLITGDTLFKESIGRTDLPTGDYDVLMESIFKKILTLPSDTQVLPGHGPHSTIGVEAQRNPFITDLIDRE